MFAHYILVAIRSVRRNFTYSAINIAGFAISLACCLTVLNYVRTELSFDAFHENGDRIFRYIPRHSENGQVAMQTWTATGLAPLLLNSFPTDIQEVCRTIEWDENAVVKDNLREVFLGKVMLADSAFFKTFTFPLTAGNANDVLSRPLSITISRKVADTYYSSESPIGKTVTYQGLDFEITGIFEEVPANSHLQFSAVVSMVSLPILWQQFGVVNGDILNDFRSWNYTTYLLTKEGVDVAKLQHDASQTFYERYTNGKTRVDSETDWLQPLGEIHFTEGIRGDVVVGNKKYVFMAITLGVVILLMACFNFMNLSTAMAMSRAREVGLRKTLGALRKQMIGQFLGETLLQVTIAVTLAIAVTQLLLPWVTSELGISLIKIPLLELVLSLVALTFLATLIGGSYPAFYLSSFNPAKVLKGSFFVGGKSGLRNLLTTFQFAAAIFFLLFSWIVVSQLKFMTDKDLGFSKESIATMYCRPELVKNYESFRNGLMGHSEIKDVTISNTRLGNAQGFWRYTFPNGEAEGSQAVTTLIVGENYLDFMDIKLKEGRKFSVDIATDATSAFIVNESFVNFYGLSNPLGTTLQVGNDSLRKGSIVGVVEDFHFQPLRTTIAPVIIRMDGRSLSLVSIKLNPGNLSKGIDVINSEMRKFTSEAPYDSKFLDESIAENYIQEQRAASFLLTLTFFALLISGLGLFGLTTYMTIRRRKEIGIRKVLGSSIPQIVRLFSKDAARLVALSALVAIPLSWIVTSNWLENFAYRVKMNVMPAIYSLAIVLMFSLAIVIIQSIRASLENPSNVLRGE